MTTDQKGAIAEAAIALAATRLNVDVYKPVAEGGRCDLILGIGNQTDAGPMQMGISRQRCRRSPVLDFPPNS
jgi:hypothetical protein